MTEQSNTVFIVDDDEAVRDALSLLMEAESLHSACFASAVEFLEAYPNCQSGCLLLDIRMPQMTGMELRDKLLAQGCALPIIFITGHGDVPLAVDAMKNGALDFIQKPFRNDELISKVREALDLNTKHLEHARAEEAIATRAASLTPREQEVMKLVVAGKANKVIAQDLAVSQRTVEIHRARVMEKMGARSIAQLVQLAGQLK